MPDSWFALMSESQLGLLDESGRHSPASHLLASWLTKTVSLPVAISRFGIKSLEQEEAERALRSALYTSVNTMCMTSIHT